MQNLDSVKTSLARNNWNMVKEINYFKKTLIIEKIYIIIFSIFFKIEDDIMVIFKSPCCSTDTH